MRITAEGWKRVAYTNSLLDADLGQGYAYDVGNGYARDKTYIRREKNGDVKVMRGPSKLTLGGNYQISLRLTKDDILHLYAEAFQGTDTIATAKQLGDIVDGMK